MRYYIRFYRQSVSTTVAGWFPSNEIFEHQFFSNLIFLVMNFFELISFEYEIIWAWIFSSMDFFEHNFFLKHKNIRTWNFPNLNFFSFEFLKIFEQEIFRKYDSFQNLQNCVCLHIVISLIFVCKSIFNLFLTAIIDQ